MQVVSGHNQLPVLYPACFSLCVYSQGMLLISLHLNHCSWSGNGLKFKRAACKNWWCQLNHTKCLQRTRRNKQFLCTPSCRGAEQQRELLTRRVSVSRCSCCILTRNSCRSFPKTSEAVWWQSMVLCHVVSPQTTSHFMHRELCRENCLSRKLTSKFLWGGHVEGACDALQLSFPDNS